MYDFFDNSSDEALLGTYIPPLWTIKYKNEDELLKWIKNTYESLKERSEPRHRRQHSNLALYKGYYLTTEKSTNSHDLVSNDRKSSYTQITVNHTFDLVEQRRSKTTRFRPTTAVIPASNEYNDKIDAQVTKEVLDTIKYENNYDEIIRKLVTRAIVLGEGYIFPLWDPDKGEWAPDYKKLRKESKDGKVTLKGKSLKDGEGNHIYSEEGEPLVIDRPICIGDVAYKMPFPWNVYLDPKQKVEDVNWAYTEEWVHIDELKALYPEKAHKIKATASYSYFDTSNLEYIELKNHCLVITLWHKSTNYLEAGLYFKATPDTLLEDIQDNPYKPLPSSEFGNLPFERLTDIDIDGELHGWSSLQNIECLQREYDKSLQLRSRNIFLSAHPKWMMPKGACEIKSLGNAGTVVQWQGPQAPQLVVFSSVPPELFTHSQNVKEDMQQIFGVFSVSRGEPPPGIKAAVALQFLDEQENQRAASSIAKYNNIIVSLDRKTLSVVSKFYNKHDKRLIKILGKDKEWMVKDFNVDVLGKPYDIRIQNSSSLPETKAARTQTVIELSQAFPALFSQEQIVDVLDLAQPGKFVDSARAAVMSAESENEDFQQNNEVQAPEMYEEHIVHWKIHMKMIQVRSFKTWPQDVQKKVAGHIMAHEAYMNILIATNPAFAQAALALTGYPAFFNPSISSQMMMQMTEPKGQGSEPNRPKTNQELMNGSGQAVATPPGGGVPPMSTPEQV